jgi:aspartate racemase
MKTVGLIGGMSWESTATYYALLNRGVQAALGGNHSAKILMVSFDFQEIEALQYSGEWALLRRRIFDAGVALKRAGADFALLCTNTMHKVVDGFESVVGIPLLHIADAVGQSVTRLSLEKAGLLGTIFTMQQDFYKSVLERRNGLEVLVPNEEDCQTINRIIYEELVKGRILDSSRQEYVRIMDGLVARGCQGIILGCTEIGLLVQDFRVPLVDSTAVHASTAIGSNFTLAPILGSTILLISSCTSPTSLRPKPGAQNAMVISGVSAAANRPTRLSATSDAANHLGTFTRSSLGP